MNNYFQNYYKKINTRIESINYNLLVGCYRKGEGDIFKGVNLIFVGNLGRAVMAR